MPHNPQSARSGFVMGRTIWEDRMTVTWRRSGQAGLQNVDTTVDRVRVSIRYLWVAAVLSCAHKEGAAGPSSAEIWPAGQVLRSRRSGDIVSRPGLDCCGLDRVEEIAIMFLSYPSPIIGNACQWLTNCCLVNLIDVTLACEDGNSKLFEVVTVANVDADTRVEDSLV